jgi:chromosome transmission fidelity protein 1
MEKSQKVNHPYSFPFKPYDVQLELMDQIYDLLKSEKKLGLFESPTGTVRSIISTPIAYRVNH